MKTLLFSFSLISIFFIISIHSFPQPPNLTTSSSGIQAKAFPHKLLSSLKDTAFGQHIIDLATTKFSDGEGIDAIVQAFDELKNQLQDFQRTEEHSYKKAHKIFEEALKKQKEIIEQCIDNINNFQVKLNNKQIKLSEKQDMINQLDLERENLKQNIKALSEVRANEKVETEMRIKNSESLIHGIQRTLGFFRQRTIGDDDLDLDAILQVTNLMGNIEDSLQQTIPEEKNSEKIANQNFKGFIKLQSTRLAQVNQEIEKVASDFHDFEQNALMLQNDIIEETKIKENAEEMKNQAEIFIKNLETGHEQNKALRAEQLKELKNIRRQFVENSDHSKKPIRKSSSM